MVVPLVFGYIQFGLKIFSLTMLYPLCIGILILNKTLIAMWFKIRNSFIYSKSSEMQGNVLYSHWISVKCLQTCFEKNFPYFLLIIYALYNLFIHILCKLTWVFIWLVLNFRMQRKCFFDHKGEVLSGSLFIII